MGVSRSTTVYNGSVAGAATATARTTTQNAESMLVIWTITDSGATGDLGATTVKPYTPYRDSANVEVTPHGHRDAAPGRRGGCSYPRRHRSGQDGPL